MQKDRKAERRKETFPESLGRRRKTKNEDDGVIKNKTAFAVERDRGS